MKAFADLVEKLGFTQSRNAKLEHLINYLQNAPDPDRGFAIAALADEMALRQVSSSLLKSMVAGRVDAELFALSYDFVGDLAETIALIWPKTAQGQSLSLSEAVLLLRDSPKGQLADKIAEQLDLMNASERLAFLKLGTGNLRVGLSRRLVQMALARLGERSLEEITQIWHGLKPPYESLWPWLFGGEAPPAAKVPFRPVMLATPLQEADFEKLSAKDYAAEWKWDGIRIQAVAEGEERRLYSRSGDDISASFPEVIEAMGFDGAFDGELIVRRGDEIGSFGDVQKRLGRKLVAKGLLQSHPAALRLYDVLIWQKEDQRNRPFSERRALLEHISFSSDIIDISPLLTFESWQDLAALRADPPSAVIEGLMLKRHDSPYIAGRPRGPWLKWKRDPMQVDAVLLYAQSGHGKRSGFYSDFTFGLWDQEGLVPVGKAYSGFSDEELRELDRFVRKNTINRFGPVRQLAPLLVVEVAFEGLNLSSRHKSGIAMRFPRISRIRWDKPAAEADQLSDLKALL